METATRCAPARPGVLADGGTSGPARKTCERFKLSISALPSTRRHANLTAPDRARGSVGLDLLCFPSYFFPHEPFEKPCFENKETYLSCLSFEDGEQTGDGDACFQCTVNDNVSLCVLLPDGRKKCLNPPRLLTCSSRCVPASSACLFPLSCWFWMESLRPGNVTNERGLRVATPDQHELAWPSWRYTAATLLASMDAMLLHPSDNIG